MSKHTPGPWTGPDENGKFNSDHEWSAEHESASSWECAPVWAAGRVIALVVHASDSLSLRSHPSVTANARLIAAAPDLLEALKGLDEAYCRAGSPLTRDERTEDRKRLISAREAIAKATGEQQ